MDEWLARLLTVTYPTLIVCGTALFGWWLKLRHDRRLAGERRGRFDQLEREMEELRARHADDLAQLHERLDFTERMLTQQRLEAAESEEPTPV
jgi:hypothetical protein